MTEPYSQQSRPQVVSVSCAGGMARQFRVQVLDWGNTPGWSLVGSYRDSHLADKVAEGLSKSGKQARVIACRSLPTAA